MDPDSKGTDDPLEGCSGEWFIVREAECSDEDTYEELFDAETQDSSLVDLVDDSEQAQGNSLALYQQIQQNETDREISAIKRKLRLTPESKAVAALSPRLGAVTLSARSDNPPKRRLFTAAETEQDSGLELSVNEAPGSTQTGSQVDTVDGPRDLENSEGLEIPKVNKLLDVFHARSSRVALLAKFKGAFDLSFTDITRPFKSDRTCYTDWVCALFGLDDCHETVCKTVIKNQCEFMCQRMVGNICLFLARFKTHKSRDTLRNLFKVTLDMPDTQMLLEPPKTNGVAAALYWYKNGLTERFFVHGAYPEWIMRQTAITGDAVQHVFSLSEMVQWAYDHDHTDESVIAYEYARLAQDDLNASAWLKTNSQARFVKECAQMCRYYKNAEMMEMSISEWVHHCCEKVKEDSGDWKPIVQFLRYQGIAFPFFLQAFKPFLKGTPKKNCLVIVGPPNTGKSMFTMSLLRFLKGRVVSYVNSKSQFWLQPLAGCKLGLLDDATMPCWHYIDVYLRNLLDGNPISVDLKHRAPVQIRCPPLIITSNVNILKEDKLKFLHSRCQVFEFTEEFPFDENGNPIYVFTDANWKSFFKRLWLQLELSDHEEEGDDGTTDKPFRCSSGKDTSSL
ncbi:putative early E1 protein [Eptesicus serotinus papillomavirus 2]|uniref:Replication protein E1 n=1 Tax=Eptesicus serotinus papillomavirus 2 TaxID=1464072 RepID=W8E8L9_9PAPI|nr:putative early E1 protein [Eptesicus serotinus papillomavirus 2]AHJ81392.1 putative early E1 protein [Eptesicus serotinus papillomavirus 2]